MPILVSLGLFVFELGDGWNGTRFVDCCFCVVPAFYTII